MKSMRKVLVGVMVVGLFGVSAPAAMADPPGPGDKQCVPGQNPPPHPGQKGGTCPGS